MLDIDGPLIPRRAFWLPGQTYILSVFDPVAVGMLLSVLELTGAKLVISSTWGAVKSKEQNFANLEKNGISTTLIHDDWVTPRGEAFPAREDEISAWLTNHPETTHHAILDDSVVKLPNLVKVTYADGFLSQHYNQLLDLLKILPGKEP